MKLLDRERERERQTEGTWVERDLRQKLFPSGAEITEKKIGIGDLEGKGGSEEMENYGDKLGVLASLSSEEAWKSSTASRDMVRAWVSVSENKR
jgi:hypothetical protein